MTNEPTIFIVDDDEAVRDSLKALLESAGLKVQAYGSGQEFLNANDPSRSGCLLLDIRMPDMSGLEVQEELVAKQDNLPIIMITGHGDIPIAVKAMKAGAFDFIEKPFKDEVILDSLRRALGLDEQFRRKESSAIDVGARVALLTPRERDVLEQLVIGRQNKVIAFDLGISPRTVEVHRARVMEKMKARSLSHLVRMALAAGINPQPS